MAETVGIINDGVTKRDLDKAALLAYLKEQAERVKTRIGESHMEDRAGLRARIDACNRLHAKVSPLNDKTIASAVGSGTWSDADFPIKVEEALATLAGELIIA